MFFSFHHLTRTKNNDREWVSKNASLMILIGLALYADRVVRREVIIDSSSLACTIFAAHVLNMCRAMHSPDPWLPRPAAAADERRKNIQIMESQGMIVASLASSPSSSSSSSSDGVYINRANQTTALLPRTLESSKTEDTQRWQEGFVYLAFAVTSTLLLSEIDVSAIKLVPSFLKSVKNPDLAQKQRRRKEWRRRKQRACTSTSSAQQMKQQQQQQLSSPPSLLQLACWSSLDNNSGSSSGSSYCSGADSDDDNDDNCHYHGGGQGDNSSSVSDGGSDNGSSSAGASCNQCASLFCHGPQGIQDQKSRSHSYARVMLSTIIMHMILVAAVMQIGVQRSTFMAPTRIMARSFGFMFLSVCWTYSVGVFCHHPLLRRSGIADSAAAAARGIYLQDFTPCQLRFAVLLFLDSGAGGGSAWSMIMPATFIVMCLIMADRVRRIAALYYNHHHHHHQNHQPGLQQSFSRDHSAQAHAAAVAIAAAPKRGSEGAWRRGYDDNHHDDDNDDDDDDEEGLAPVPADACSKMAMTSMMPQTATSYQTRPYDTNSNHHHISMPPISASSVWAASEWDALRSSSNTIHLDPDIMAATPEPALPPSLLLAGRGGEMGSGHGSSGNTNNEAPKGNSNNEEDEVLAMFRRAQQEAAAAAASSSSASAGPVFHTRNGERLGEMI